MTQENEIKALIADLKGTLNAIDGTQFKRLFVSYESSCVPSKQMMSAWLKDFGIECEDMVLYPHRRPFKVIGVAAPAYDEDGQPIPFRSLGDGWIPIEDFNPLIGKSQNHIFTNLALNTRYQSYSGLQPEGQDK